MGLYVYVIFSYKKTIITNILLIQYIVHINTNNQPTTLSKQNKTKHKLEIGKENSFETLHGVSAS